MFKKIILLSSLLLINNCVQSTYIDNYSEPQKIIIDFVKHNKGEYACIKGCSPYQYTFCEFKILNTSNQQMFILKDSCQRYNIGDKITFSKVRE